ncbi:cystatin-B-like [Astyanax mexicanus]|uniref:Cystatin-B n=1 Tax=Astyanax mexicanus TaxID=7994 RepID=A0A8B9HY89_ASTMX|nr:cystatin-B-like [Astyanax mexicanus]
MSTMCGGMGEEKPATPEIQNICDTVKSDAEKKSGQNFGVFVAKSFTTQVVAGTNYFIKVHVGGEEYVHLRVFKSLPHAGEKLQVHGVKTSKTHNEPISYF